ncbi:hypothetical protein [Roseibium sediminicola]|uniref:Uncharacterized protein n=1 Tax=Roseibium sediminicola TaxID=2933272 RepID=A0ABT0H3C9_9HYPH|nr:hypothetical protein [Roseibium sp. CAU 1639]MCK7616179.1 hypothetical protein [Roseibium sp. CAU 1639]
MSAAHALSRPKNPNHANQTVQDFLNSPEGKAGKWQSGKVHYTKSGRKFVPDLQRVVRDGKTNRLKYEFMEFKGGKQSNTRHNRVQASKYLEAKAHGVYNSQGKSVGNVNKTTYVAHRNQFGRSTQTRALGKTMSQFRVRTLDGNTGGRLVPFNSQKLSPRIPGGRNRGGTGGLMLLN